MLTQDQLDFYQENGYLHVKGLFTARRPPPSGRRPTR